MDLLSSQADNSSVAKKPCPSCQREFDLTDAETFPLHLEKRGVSWVMCLSSFAEPEQEFNTRVSGIKATAPVFKPASKPVSDAVTTVSSHTNECARTGEDYPVLANADKTWRCT